MERAAAHDGPVYLRLARDPSPVLFGDGYRFEIGARVLLRDGRDVAILSTGLQTHRALAAATSSLRMGSKRWSSTCRQSSRCPADAVAEAARRTGAVVTAEDHSIIGGLGGQWPRSWPNIARRP